MVEIFQGRRDQVIGGVLKEKMGKLAVGVEEEEEERQDKRRNRRSRKGIKEKMV